MLTKPDTSITRYIAELSATSITPATLILASSIAILLDKIPRSATDIEALLDNHFDYLVSKLPKYICTHYKVNITLRQNSKAIVEEDNSNTKLIMLNILATIASFLPTMS